jgi:flagellar basal body-associated protein FliL
MGLITKLEEFINRLLLALGGFLLGVVKRLTPARVKKLLTAFQLWRAGLGLKLKAAPALILTWVQKKIQAVKDSLAAINIKEQLKEAYERALPDSKEKISGFQRALVLLLAPFNMFRIWLSGLSVGQSLLLIAFTGASFLGMIGIFWSGQKLASKHLEEGRTPASLEELELYDRPNYYKKERRHLDITNLHLPVYMANVNELKTVSIDFTATLSTRESRMYLNKYEHVLRDHLIHHIEQIVADFPLQDEGKEILRKKLEVEINAFLKEHGMEGKVTEVQITYVLAN